MYINETNAHAIVINVKSKDFINFRYCTLFFSMTVVYPKWLKVFDHGFNRNLIFAFQFLNFFNSKLYLASNFFRTISLPIFLKTLSSFFILLNKSILPLSKRVSQNL